MPESPDATLTLYYAPRTRAITALWLLEEMNLAYRVECFDIMSGRQKRPDFLALNPMGKVPTIVDRGTPISEMAAIALYLADRYPDSAMAPSIDDPRRAAYLRWVVFAGGVMEPAYAEKFAKAEPRPGTHAWGSFDQMVEVVSAAVQPGPFLLGDMFTAADVLVGSALRFGLLFGILPKQGPLADYVARVTAREGFRRASAIDAHWGTVFPPAPR